MSKFQYLQISISIFLSLFCIIPTLSQPYEIGHIKLQLVDISRDDRPIPVEVYYPALTAGEEVPAAPGQFPVLSYGHGFVMGVDSYTNFSNTLVPLGYIFVLPNTETGFSPSHIDLALDLSFIINAMSEANADPESIFFGVVAPRSAVMGHSMGGGASLLAAAADTAVYAVVNFAAANTTPSAISASANITLPALLFAGSEDCVTPPSQHQEIMYDSLASSCKTIISITGGGHCYFANDNFLCTFGENSCNPNLTITRAEQQDVTFDFLIPWLDYHLKSNTDAWEIFSDSLTSSMRITFEQDCDLTIIRETGGRQPELKIFPVPFKDYFRVEGNFSLKYIEIYDLSGREVFCGKPGNQLPSEFSMTFLDPGIYHLRFTLDNGDVLTRVACKF
jgi:dienelactone hydrolase